MALASWMRVWQQTKDKDKLLAVNKRQRLLGRKLVVVSSILGQSWPFILMRILVAWNMGSGMTVPLGGGQLVFLLFSFTDSRVFSLYSLDLVEV